MTCKNCGGNGSVKCPQCDGKGREIGFLSNEEWKHCAGSGHVMRRVCKGKGAV